MESTIKKFLHEQGLKINKIIRETKKSTVVIASKNKKSYLIKMAINKDYFFNIKNEVEANKFINKISAQANEITTPRGGLIANRNYTLGIFDFVDGKNLADQTTLKIKAKPTIQELEQLYQLQKKFYQLKKKMLPDHFQTSSSQYTFSKYLKKIDSYLEKPLGKLISESEKKRLVSNLKKTGYYRAFQHHDFVLWNMIRQKKNIVLVDSEYARWGMKWYDLAYFFIQTYVYLQQPLYAKKCLAFFVKRFEKDFPRCNIRQEIMFPMNYRITANINEALGNKKLEKLAHELLHKILTNNFINLLR